jgi:sigma-B regulation protein RsbU (phosphoserine phosphatase)
VAKFVFPIAGVAMGVLFGLMGDVAPEGAFSGPARLVAGGILLVFLASYLVFDVTVGLEMQEKRSVEADLALARQIQRRMLPAALPEVPGYGLAAHHEPAQSIGGDAYDALLLDNGRLLLAVADVSGKGASAALLMMGVLARLRALARTGMDVAELAARLNEAMVDETETEHFSTLIIAELDPATGRLDYVNAGNTPPLLVRADGSAEMLERGGLPVGMLPDMPYEGGVVHLQPGDRLLMFTDGLEDADESGGELLGAAELQRLLAARPAGQAAAAAAALAHEVQVRRGDDRFDDVTFLLLARL